MQHECVTKLFGRWRRGLHPRRLGPIQGVGRLVCKSDLFGILRERDYCARHRKTQNRGVNQPMRMMPFNHVMKANHTNSYSESQVIQQAFVRLPQLIGYGCLPKNL
jgi:hypothetical protein